MKAEHKQKWIDALRSGQFRQTDSYLYDTKSNSFCCLGVLAHVVGGVTRKALEDAGTCGFLAPKIGGDFGLGPESNEDDPWYIDRDPKTHTTLQRKLAGLNDQGKPFAEIADWIEANVPAE